MSTKHLWIVLPALALAAALSASAPAAPPPPAPITAQTPSGGTFRVTARATSGGGLCERLVLRLKDDRAESRSCQARRGTGAHGLWHAACGSGDLVVYGTAYARRASAAFRTRKGRIVRGHTRAYGDRELFAVVVGRGDLPGRLRVRARDGRTLARLDFDGVRRLCRSSGQGTPLDASYSF